MGKKKGTKTSKTKGSSSRNAYQGLFESTPRNFGLGGTVQPVRDLTRFVRWPKYVTLQRQKRVLFKRLRIPGPINQIINQHCTSNDTKSLFKLLQKYSAESKEEKKARLLAAAQAKREGQEVNSAKPNLLKFGLNQVTTLVEQRQAQLVVIAADVDPIELVCWLPALCRATETPFCIVKSQSALGKFVGLKRTTCVAITSVDKADQHSLDQLREMFTSKFNNDLTFAKKPSKMIMGVKFQHREAAQKRAKEAELLRRGA
eukprot:TRINITY_DN1903_c0_g1_i2.p1 TRINITY_DN1903_c0_g1~~TRINITY_DN1903_c0_g1_i2.p1  ORF type:complete len:259 (-),score=47.37 TRINITY_DN1903_c0_g1_i2:16-792(-)